MLKHLRLNIFAQSVQCLQKSPLPLPLSAITLVRCLSVSPQNFGRAEWMKLVRPKMIPHMPLPSYLKDGTVRRNQGRSGRDHTGRVIIRHRGGGHQQTYRIVDFHRVPFAKPGEEPQTITERVLQIGYDPCRSGRIAKVAGNGSNKFKLILAPDGLSPGDVITASRAPPEFVSRLKTGDAYPVGNIPLGTNVHNIELYPGRGGQMARAAGTFAKLISKSDGKVTVELPSGRKVTVEGSCLATIGRVSNVDNNKDIIGKAGRNRWLGRRPKGKTGKDRWQNQKKRV